MTQGRIPIRVFFCTDPRLFVRTILEGYGQRWAIEVCFRDLEQLLGFADSSARKQAAVERTAPFVGLAYSTLVLWAISHASDLANRLVPLRPWYLHEQGLSFADILRAARVALADLDVFDLPDDCGDLQKPPLAKPTPANAAPGGPPLGLAA